MKKICLLLVAAGFSSFIATEIVDLFPGVWPNSYEWPVGFTDNIITTQSGLYIVPVTPVNRIQLYNSNWEYIRGWHVGNAGSIIVMPFDEEKKQIDVMNMPAQKGLHRIASRYRFDINGKLLSEAAYPSESYYSLTKTGLSLWLPTHFWLIPFSSPAIAWVIFAFGLICMWFTVRFQGSRTL